MTLYILGGVVMDTFPFNADSFDRSAGADLVSKSVMGGLAPSEFTGEGDDQITISGQLLPTKIGGLDEFEVLDGMRKKGARFPIMRGDGKRFGTYAISQISEKHTNLGRTGVGFTVGYSVTCKKVQGDAGQAGGASLISAILSIFDAVK